MNPTNEHDDLYSTILNRPADDAPRLEYAAWCERNDRSVRAEFIRLQIGMKAATVGCDCYGCAPPRRMVPHVDRLYCEPRLRQLDLFDSLVVKGFAKWVERPGPTAVVTVRITPVRAASFMSHGVVIRGFVSALSLATRELVTAECPHCRSKGYRRGQGRDGRWFTKHCGACEGTGWQVGAGVADLHRHPFSSVWLYDAGLRLEVRQPADGHGWRVGVCRGSNPEPVDVLGEFFDRGMMVRGITEFAADVVAGRKPVARQAARGAE